MPLRAFVDLHKLTEWEELVHDEQAKYEWVDSDSSGMDTDEDDDDDDDDDEDDGEEEGDEEMEED